MCMSMTICSPSSWIVTGRGEAGGVPPAALTSSAKLSSRLYSPTRTPEQSVADRVQQDVGVGMAKQPLLVRNIEAADDELSPGDERMHVEPLPDSHGCPRARQASAMARSSAKVTFKFCRLPVTSR